jgi:hypothetical protein
LGDVATAVIGEGQPARRIAKRSQVADAVGARIVGIGDVLGRAAGIACRQNAVERIVGVVGDGAGGVDALGQVAAEVVMVDRRAAVGADLLDPVAEPVIDVAGWRVLGSVTLVSLSPGSYCRAVTRCSAG